MVSKGGVGEEHEASKAPKPKAKASAKSSKPAVEPSRRSTRISSQVTAEPVKDQAKKPPRTAKKRAADDTADDEAKDADKKAEGSSNKKAKEGNVEGSEEKDELASDVSEDLKSINIGDRLPSLTLKNEKDEDVEVQSLAAENGLVFFLVPRADTPGCTNQACGFRDNYPEFEAVNFKVYCLSADTPAAQSKWQNKFTLPYPLLSDRKRVLIKALGAADGSKTKRSHFVFEKGGKLLDKKMPVKPADSPKLAMEFIKKLQAGSSS